MVLSSGEPLTLTQTLGRSFFLSLLFEFLLFFSIWLYVSAIMLVSVLAKAVRDTTSSQLALPLAIAIQKSAETTVSILSEQIGSNMIWALEGAQEVLSLTCGVVPSRRNIDLRL